MTPEKLFEILEQRKLLADWIKQIEDGDKESVTGEWYNNVLRLTSDLEDMMCEMSREFWELGLQCFDWDAFYDLMVKRNVSA